ncbi:hypothetical protein [Caballeronia zhejiangensis]|uniref:Uncharacterized protein n=1 Tax=Caballeronia zhejiangensis TaxID=871203 RepID=A0A656QEJ9_9BURK|nr:hypothetical protein [Caballeronia zhejiangensis]KDR25991.1 hypothetical protein BG60_26325 [Caballeronia zhejiangensis]
MSIRKYWMKHPVQLRVAALLTLVLMPIWLPIVAVVQYRREIVEEIRYQYADTWRVLTKGRGA